MLANMESLDDFSSQPNTTGGEYKDNSVLNDYFFLNKNFFDYLCKEMLVD